MKIAAAYLRVSTERQDEYSLDSQLKLIREYAGKNDYIVPEDLVFIDDGISGRSAEKRPEFQRMIGQAKSQSCPFEAILVWKYSRFARNQEESILYKAMLSRSGVEVVSISEPLIEGPFGSLIERILEWMDEFYSIRLSAEVKRGMTEKVSHSLSIAKANKLVIEALQQAVELCSFPVAPQRAPALAQGPDYERLIKQEYTKLARVQEAYEAGIDTLEEYGQKKKKLLGKIQELESPASAAPAQEVDLEEYRQKVVDVLELLRSDTATEAAKNAALKSIISHIVYEKAQSRLAIYFYY